MCSPKLVAIIVLTVWVVSGCRSRHSAYNSADQIAQTLIAEKACVVPEGLPCDFSLTPLPESRLAVDGCCPECPLLPQNPIELYAYQLPLRNTVDPNLDSEDEDSGDQVGIPIPLDAWEAIPRSCLDRMYDFKSIRSEAKFTRDDLPEGKSLTLSQSSDPRLSLEEIVDMALLNSRNYQTQKETLYLVALSLSQERFAYVRKFSAGNNGGSAEFGNFRNNGQSEERLNIAGSLQVDRMLATGGDILAQFANNILLTFDGPTGFTADVSSSILIQFVQPLIQVDIQFESLTQAERDLVYAARDFARFRKSFFVGFASDYYDLIASFRQVEINSQNYFSLVRAFKQAEAEYAAGIVPRVQVDQVEQSLLNGRGQLIGTCNSLEQSLDSLKISMGLPTETPINVDLEELNELTRLDQLSVSADSTNRVLKRLSAATVKPDRFELASTAAVLLDRLIDAIELGDESEQGSKKLQDFEQQRANFLMDYARLNADRIGDDLEKQLNSDAPSQPVIFQRATAYCKSLLALTNRQIQVAKLERGESLDEDTDKIGAAYVADPETENSANEDEDTTPDRNNVSRPPLEKGSDVFTPWERDRKKLSVLVDGLDTQLRELIVDEAIERLPELIEQALSLQKQLASLVENLDEKFDIEVSKDAESDLIRIKKNVVKLIATAQEELNAPGLGLKPIDINMDDAMVTAIVLRYELMNQRGILADDWRQIKLAADELQSALSLQASHRIDTPPGDNQPFNFDLDNSATTVGLTFDSALNRFSERNNFRASLINYQQSLRSLKLLEDNVKFSVRNDLRSLSLDREQYLISVASAALAYERVVSTSLEFRLGTGGVSARDFLEAQTAYTNALSDVANQHIQYLVDRTQLFFDLELLFVDGRGFWDDLRNEDVQPEPQFQIPAWGKPVYGNLPDVRYSSTVKQILQPVNDLPVIGDRPVTDERP